MQIPGASNSQDEGDNEKLVIPFESLIQIINEQGSIHLQEDERAFMKRAFSIRGAEHFARLDQVLKIMRNFGIREGLPRSKKHLNYENLNLKSKRIINRLCMYLDQSEKTIEELLKDIVLRSTVKTKTKTEKVETIKAEEFFKLLYEVEVIDQNKINQNICYFLCIDKSYPHTLMFKKIKRAV